MAKTIVQNDVEYMVRLREKCCKRETRCFIDLRQNAPKPHERSSHHQPDVFGWARKPSCKRLSQETTDLSPHMKMIHQQARQFLIEQDRGLQLHKSHPNMRVEFRNIRIKELLPPAAAPFDAKKAKAP